jgi:hypothetical protein
MERKVMIVFFVVVTIACIFLAAFSTSVAKAFVYILLAAMGCFCGCFAYFGKKLMQ